MPAFVILRVLIRLCKQSLVCETRRNNSYGQAGELSALLWVTMGSFIWLTLCSGHAVNTQQLLNDKKLAGVHMFKSFSQSRERFFSRPLFGH